MSITKGMIIFMKKLNYLLFTIPLFLVACIRPPVPDVEQANLDINPNVITPLDNALTEGYFRTALPLESSPTRGLIHTYIRNRADIEQVESSLMRLSTDFFDPDYYFFREGIQLSRDFVINILQPHEPDTENHIGLNPPLGSSHNFGGTIVESVSGNSVRPFAYVLEHNFVTIVDEEFQLEGAAIAIALNPYHWERDLSIGHEDHLRMSDSEIIEIGQDIADDLLPLLRQQEGLENVPIILGLFILRSDREVIPGNFASITYIEEGHSSISSWNSVQEQHFRLPNNAINVHDVKIDDEFNFFSNTIKSHFPHQYGLVARAHVVDGSVYRVSIVFDMSFYGLSEMIGFHQLVAEQVMHFSPEYDIRIIIRNPSTIHGSVTRPPFAKEASIHRISW